MLFFWYALLTKVSKGAKIRNRYNQVPLLTQDTNGKVTNSQLDTTNESQEVSPFPGLKFNLKVLQVTSFDITLSSERIKKRCLDCLDVLICLCFAFVIRMQQCQFLFSGSCL